MPPALIKFLDLPKEKMVMGTFSGILPYEWDEIKDYVGIDKFAWYDLNKVQLREILMNDFRCICYLASKENAALSLGRD